MDQACIGSRYGCASEVVMSLRLVTCRELAVDAEDGGFEDEEDGGVEDEDAILSTPDAGLNLRRH